MAQVQAVRVFVTHKLRRNGDLIAWGNVERLLRTASISEDVALRCIHVILTEEPNPFLELLAPIGN